MIGSVRGEVTEIALDHAMIDVGGLGYLVKATPATLATLQRGTEARLLTTMIVREDAMTLYGFADDEQRELFVLLQTVSGVGPRLALAVLTVLDPEDLRKALADSNVAALTRVPGVGKRGAERMIVELRDKVAAVPVPVRAGTAPPPAPAREQLVEALTGLGFPAKHAEQATEAVLAAEPELDTAAALRAALRMLGRNR